MLTETWNQWN